MRETLSSPRLFRGAWQSGAVADSEQFTAGVHNSLLLCLDMLTKTFRVGSSNIGAAQSTPVCPHYTASKLLRWGHVNFPAPSLQSLADQSGNALTGEQRLSRFQQQMLRVARLIPL